MSLDATTARLPLLGDLPVLGPFFSNTTHKRQEKELLVIVTPYLVSPLHAQDVPPLPGEEIMVPDDLEFFLSTAGPVGFAPPPSQNQPEESLPPPSVSSRRTERKSSP